MGHPYRALMARLRPSTASADLDAQAEAASESLLRLIARLRPDLTVDDALVEVDLALAEFAALVEGDTPAQAPARPRRGRHLYALVAAAATSAGLNAPRVLDAVQALTWSGVAS